MASNGNGVIPETTTRTDPPAGVTPRIGIQQAARRSAALADEAQTELGAIRKRITQLDTELDTLYAEQARLTRITRAAGVTYQEDA